MSGGGTVATKQTLTVGIAISGARETLAAFRGLPKEASQALRERSMDLAQSLAGKVASAARGDSGQSALIAPTVKAVRDRVPVITAGGTKRVGRNSVPAYKIIFGSEFGARTLAQYRPHLGRGSYWMFKTVKANEAQIAAAWRKVADDIEQYFRRPSQGERIAQIQADQHAQVDALFADVHARFGALGLPEV